MDSISSIQPYCIPLENMITPVNGVCVHSKAGLSIQFRHSFKWVMPGRKIKDPRRLKMPSAPHRLLTMTIQMARKKKKTLTHAIFESNTFILTDTLLFCRTTKCPGWCEEIRPGVIVRDRLSSA